MAIVLAALVPQAPAGPSTGPRVGPNVPVTLEDLANRAANNSPVLAADPTQPRFVALANRLDGPDFGCTLQLSGDGGRGWLTVNPVPRLPRDAEKCYAPEIAFDRRGRLHYLFLGLRGAGNSPMGAFLTTTSDHGATFTRPRQILGPQRYQVRMAIDPDVGDAGRIHLVWLETTSAPPLGGLPPPPNPLMAAYSDDGGRTFSNPVQISDPDRARAVAPALALSPNHAVHVLYYDLQDDARDYHGLEGPAWEGTWSLVLTTSIDGGRRFRRGVVVDDELVPPERVMLIYTMAPASLAADGDGRLFAAWYDARNGDWDIFLRRSADGGGTWSAPRRLNDDGRGNGQHQYLPRLAVAPGGRVDAIFYDRRGNEENRGNDVYFTYSTDHGASFARNLRLTTIDSDSKIGPRYEVPSATGLNEIGSRIGLWSERSKAVAAWTDTRNTGRAFPAQDIFSATVAFPDEAGPGWPLAVVGFGAVVAAMAVVALGARRRRRKAAVTA